MTDTCFTCRFWECTTPAASIEIGHITVGCCRRHDQAVGLIYHPITGESFTGSVFARPNTLSNDGCREHVLRGEHNE